MSENLFIFHGHFYQPPRENPWTGLVSREQSAAPSHDWNQRIDQECYRPNAYGRILDEAQFVAEIVNNYEFISFNLGPTLAYWLEQHDPLTLARMVAADQKSALANGGHGNALAQAYNHMILPLADKQDRRTQIHWGLAAFQAQFQREAEAMWLPETAANHEVLDELIEQGMRFVILAPQQAARIRGPKQEKWQDVSGGKIDGSRPYFYRHRDGSGRRLAVFFYDGELAHEVAFEDALNESERLVQQVLAAQKRANAGPLVHLATDGETAGHHHAWGDRVLSHALTRALPEKGLKVSNYGHALDLYPPSWEVELDLGPKGEGSSWSCAHGVGRWIRDCGCKVSPKEGWKQSWRTGLRRAMDMLRDASRPYFEEEAGKLLHDPWSARDDYIRVLLNPGYESCHAFLREHGRGDLPKEKRVRALSLLEMQHQLMLQYTSCGWFFDDISGIESRQVLRYAARAIDLWTEMGGAPPAAAFLDHLTRAKSNVEGVGNGTDLFREIVTSDTVDPRQILVHALLRSKEADDANGGAGEWKWRVRSRERQEKDGCTLHTGRVSVRLRQTQRSFHGAIAVLERGDLDLRAHVCLDMSEEDFNAAGRRLGSAFNDGIEIDVLDEEFNDLKYDSESLLSSGGRELLAPLITRSYESFQSSLSRLHHDHQHLLAGVERLGLDEPKLLGGLARIALEAALNEALLRALADQNGEALKELKKSAELARGCGMEIDWSVSRAKVESTVVTLLAESELPKIEKILAWAEELGIPLHLYRAQEQFFEAGSTLAPHESALRVGKKLGISDGLVQSILKGVR